MNGLYQLIAIHCKRVATSDGKTVLIIPTRPINGSENRREKIIY